MLWSNCSRVAAMGLAFRSLTCVQRAAQVNHGLGGARTKAQEICTIHFDQGLCLAGRGQFQRRMGPKCVLIGTMLKLRPIIRMASGLAVMIASSVRMR